ncbi:MAG: DUF4129 domain-containing protein [Anaerolineales bacterium]
MRRLNWIEDLLLPLAVALLTAAWLNLWLRWLASVDVPGPPPVTPSVGLMALLVLGGAFVTRWAVRRAMPPMAGPVIRLPREPGRQAQQIVLGAGLAAILAALWLTYGRRFPLGYARGLVTWGNFLSAELIVLVACAYLWWRGIRIGQSHIPYQDLEQAFYRGIVALAVALGVNRFLPLVAPAEALQAMLVFFAIGLMALTLASFQRARRQQKETTGVWLSLNRYWVTTAAGAIGSVLLGGLAVAGLVAPESLSRLNAWLRPWLAPLEPISQALGAAFAIGLTWLLTPVFIFVEWLIRTLITALRFPKLPQLPPANEAAARAVEAFLNSAVVKFSSRTLVVLVILGVAAALFWLAVRRFLALPPQEVDETRESIISRELIWNQLRGLFARKRSTGPTPPAPPYLALTGPPNDPRLMVRRAYQGMLEWARQHGLPRPAGQTPGAYAEALVQLSPQLEEAITVLTRAYVRARYAAEAPSLEEAQRAEAAAAQLPTAPPTEAIPKTR